MTKKAIQSPENARHDSRTTAQIYPEDYEKISMRPMCEYILHQWSTYYESRISSYEYKPEYSISALFRFQTQNIRK